MSFKTTNKSANFETQWQEDRGVEKRMASVLSSLSLSWLLHIHAFMSSVHGCRSCVIDHEPAYTPPHPRILPHGNIWVPRPSKYTVQVVCKWAVAVCVCCADSDKCTIWNSKLQWPCLLATHLLWQKRPFPYIILLLEQFNMLQFSVSLCLKCVLVTGHCGRRNIKVPPC